MFHASFAMSGFIRRVAAVAPVLTLLAVPLAADASAETRYVFANSSKYDTLDPHTTYDVARVGLRINLYDGLYRWQANPPKLEPWLAESHTVSPDGKTYMFKLRKNVKFHDGSTLTPEDIVYSMERILALKRGAYSLFAPLVAPGSTKAIDADTVQFNLKEPSAIFMSMTPEIYAVNAALLKKNTQNDDWGNDWLAKNDAGTGAYKLERYDPAIGFVARRFPDHFKGWGSQFIDVIDFRTVTEGNTKILGLMRGDFHGTDGYLPQDQIQKLRGSPNVQVIEEESMRLFHIAIFSQRPPLDDVHYRRMLNYAFDYDGFINDILKGAVVRNPGPIPNNMWGAVRDIRGYSYDLEKAKEELAKVNAPLRPVTIVTLAGYDQTQFAATILQNGLRKIGVESKIEVVPFPVVEQRILKPETTPDMLVTFKSTSFADPHNWVGVMFNSKNAGSRNQGYYKNEKVDALLDKAVVSSDTEERRKLYEEASRVVVDDAGAILVSNSKWFGVFSSKLKGIRFCPIGEAQEMRTAYFAN
ncbi:MAG: ABC transporter substrate-binding protein [Alphaproteobacteria bacterium]|nr:ABC transporter substrate-binding protein [Alphaproteobacteria bacterium]